MVVTGFYGRLAPDYIADDGSIGHRFDLWRGALKMIAASPLRGWGTGESGAVYMNWFQAIGGSERYMRMVNSYLQVATEYGLPVLVLVLAAIWTVGRRFMIRAIDANGRISRFGPAVAAAGASAIAWAVANLFTTLWLEYRLWIIPAISIVVVMLLVRPVRSRWRMTPALGFSVVVAAGLWVAGLELAKHDSCGMKSGVGNTVIAIRQGRNEALPPESPIPQDWQLWPDRGVLGLTPGQEIRRWMEALPLGARVTIHPPAPCIIRSRHVHGVMLFGRQVERSNELFGSGLTADEVWLVHPFSRNVCPISAEYGNARLNVVLPEVDQAGQNAHWRAWAASSGANMLVSANAGTDIRLAWPAVCGVKDREFFGAPTEQSAASAGARQPGPEVASLAADQRRLWLGIEARFQGIGLDGAWRQSYPLKTSRMLRDLNFVCRLEHRLEVDADGRPRTFWAIPALKSWLVPVARDKLEFVPPAGTPVRFDLATVGEAFDRAKSAIWKIRKTGRQSFELLSPSRSVWTYSRGLLTGIDDPALGRFVVLTQGGSIREIRSLDLDAAMPLLAADYDTEGNPIRLAVGDNRPETFMWSNGDLVEWQRGDGRTVKFHYVGGLISKIDEPGRSVRHVTWANNPHFLRGDSSWYEPVSLQADDLFDYSYSLTDQGYLILVTNRTSQERSSMLFNPLRDQLQQSDSTGRTFVVTFRTTAMGRSPEKIYIRNGFFGGH